MWLRRLLKELMSKKEEKEEKGDKLNGLMRALPQRAPNVVQVNSCYALVMRKKKKKKNGTEIQQETDDFTAWN